MAVPPAVRIYRFFSSFGLATAVLALLLIVTYLGTLEQLDHGLFESQRKYFESFFITEVDVSCCMRAMNIPWREGSTLPVLIPGGYLLMVLLAINMILGGIIRLKKEIMWFGRLLTGRWGQLRPVPRAIGVLIAHASIVFMLLAALVSLYFKKEGAVWVREGRTVDQFESFHESVIEIERVNPQPEGGKRKTLVIDGKDFTDLKEGKARTFTNAALPFKLTIMNYMEHCAPRRSREGGPMEVDGYRLQQLPERDQDNKLIPHENLMGGAYAKIVDRSGNEQRGILWRQASPWVIKVGDETYAITLGHRTYALPFAVKLDKFEREVHPGTMQARKFSSHVTVTRDGHDEKKIITMNEPLRYGGFAFFQSSFDSAAADSGGPQASMFQVGSNPSDHWPLASLIAAGIGLLVHMIWMLVRYLSRTHSHPSTVQAGGN